MAGRALAARAGRGEPEQAEGGWLGAAGQLAGGHRPLEAPVWSHLGCFDYIWAFIKLFFPRLQKKRTWSKRVRN